MVFEHVMRIPPEGGEEQEMLAIAQAAAIIEPLDVSAEYGLTFSVWAYSEANAGLNARIGSENHTVEFGAGWQRIEIPFAVGGTITITVSGAQTVYLYKAQLETGNRSTDWKPAPEDAEEAIDEARNSAEAAQNRADEAYDELNSRLLLDTDGLHVGKQDDAADRRNEILIRTGSNPTIDFIFDGVAEASIAKDYHRFGNMEIRVPSVGGFIFQAVGGGE